jgi:hypothetical protein
MWQIDKSTKQCRNCGVFVGVNQDYFSALVVPETNAGTEQPDNSSPRFIRYDFCINCWERRTASGEDTPFSFWQTRIATPPELPKTPKQVLLSFFDNLFVEEPHKENSIVGIKEQIKYLFSLILLRKRLLKLTRAEYKDNKRFLLLERTGDNKTYEVAEINISEKEFIALRNEFSKLFEFRI